MVHPNDDWNADAEAARTVISAETDIEKLRSQAYRLVNSLERSLDMNSQLFRDYLDATEV